MRAVNRVLILVGVIVMANAHGRTSSHETHLMAAESALAPAAIATEASDVFAAKLYRQLANENPGQNLFFSPYSVSIALAMTAEAARGQTALEMGTVLGWPGAVQRAGGDAQRVPWQTDRIHAGLAQLSQRFNRPGKPYRLSIANAIWSDQSFELRKSYVETIDNAYETGGVRLADFRGNPEGERQRINRWVEEQTKDRIQDLVKKGMIDSDTAVVLANAMYFKGNWASQFDKQRTRPLPFTRLDGSKVTVPMMSQTAKVPFASVELAGQDNTRAQMVELAYEGDELSMLLLMPSKPGRLPALEEKLTPANLKAWTARLAAVECQLSLPKFRLETEYELVQTLSDLGMPSAFGAGADFSGMTDEPSRVSISDVLHKAFVEVDEQGTEAAAATAVIMKRGGYPIFAANRPFLFLIRDRATGVILLCGRLVDPPING